MARGRVLVCDGIISRLTSKFLCISPRDRSDGLCILMIIHTIPTSLIPLAFIIHFVVVVIVVVIYFAVTFTAECHAPQSCINDGLPTQYGT